jgi:hypothetical protein
MSADEDRRMVVSGDRIVFNGDVGSSKGEDGLTGDYSNLLDLAAANPNVSIVALTGRFPSTGYAMDVARGIEGLGFATTIEGECTDACIYIFVAGSPRSFGKGAKLGLRRLMTTAAHLKESFEQNKAAYGWEDEFGQAAMVYDLAQSSMRSALQYLLEHGVSLEFALQIFATPREDMWWPERDELLTSGVILK